MASDLNIDELTFEEKRQLLEELLASDPASHDEFVTSYAQERLWLLDKLSPENPIYNICAAVRIRGSIDVARVEASLDHLIARHETLRTVIVERDGVPMQRILPPWKIHVPTISLPDEGTNANDEATQTNKIVEAFICQPFDISAGPLFRVQFISISEFEHIALFAMHHAVSDGWSLGVLIQEFVTAYTQLANGESVELPPLEIQYADYAVWQKDSSDLERDRIQLEYWLKKLQGSKPLKLPVDAAVDQNGPTLGMTIVRRMTSVQTQALHKLVRQQSGTLFMGLLATLSILLARLGGQDDVAVGTPIAGRTRKELEPLIGCFLNTLCLRTAVASESTFLQHFTEVRKTAIEAYANQDVPYERVLSSLNSNGSGEQHALFNVLLNLLSYHSPKLHLPGASIERFELPESFAKFDLTIYVEPMDEELELRVVYRRDRFAQKRVEIMLDQWIAIVEQVCENPSIKLEDITLRTAKTSHLLFDPQVSLVPRTLPTVAELVSTIAATYPGHVAVEQGDRKITYADLMDRAELIKNAILRGSDSLHDVVAIEHSKSIELVVAMLAVQLSGRVMLCVDMELPEQRKRQMLEIASAHLIVDDSGVRETNCCREVPLNKSWDSPAYVFFTSGSSGVPKAVLGSAQGLTHFIVWQKQQFGIAAEDRFAQLTAASFDVLLRDIFLPLCSGATICLPPSHNFSSSDQVLRWLDANRISVLHSVPSLLRYWFSSDPHTKVASLRFLFSAGEPLGDGLCGQLRHRFPAARIVNLYGPTETTLAKCFKNIDKSRAGVQMVGRPIPDTQVLVQKSGRLCGVGEAGEIVLRTPYRSFGYLDQSLTAKAFRPNPWRTDQEDLLYHTGDIGRIDPTGELEIMGRSDDQVKIRGVRVELNEIANVLQQCPSLKDAALSVKEDCNGDKQLVAYVVYSDHYSTDSREELYGLLNRWLMERLPVVMVPAHYVSLESLPYLPNGKVDRKRLPEVKLEVTPCTGEYEAPVGEMEIELYSIWRELLRCEKIGRNENFFQIGGHSLLAAQLVARIENRLNATIQLRSIFEHSTIAQLAQHLRTCIDDRQDQLLPELKTRKDPSHAPLSLSQEALWFLDQLNPRSGAYTTYPVFRAVGNIDLEILQRALDFVVHRHEVLRTTFPELDGQPVQRVAPDSEQKIEYLDLSTLPNAEKDARLQSWLSSQLRTGIDLQVGPIVRLQLAKIAEAEYVVLIAWHHIIHDGWSLGILAKEILTAYEAFANDTNPQLPELKIQFADWAVWQRDLLSGEYLEKLQHYWRQRLRDVPALALITDHPRPAVRTTRGDWQGVEIDHDLSNRIKTFASQNNVTPFMVFLSAYYMTLARYSGQHNFAIGSPVANRKKRETEDLIGYFINMLVLRPDIATSRSCLDVIKEVKATVLDAFEHQDLTLDQVVYAVNPPRDASRHPLFQAMFVLHNNRPLPTSGTGVEFQAFDEPPIQSSYFELNLAIQETSDRYTGRLIYNCDLFDARTAQRLLSSMQLALEAIVLDASTDWRAVQLLDQTQRDLVQKFSLPDRETLKSDRFHSTLHDEFSRVAEKYPERVAVDFGGNILSYRELESLSDRFATRLQTFGVKQGDIVATLMSRSLDAIVCILGALKAGAAYMPLDEKSPAFRNAKTLEDSQARFIVTDFDVSQWNTPVRIIDGRGVSHRESTADESSAPVMDVSIQNPHEEAAYVIYTSGSTGNPKGVVVSHAAALAYVAAAVAMYDITSEDRILQFSSLSFDAHVEELYCALLSGATLVLRDDRMLDSIVRFISECNKHRISILSVSTGFWHELALESIESVIDLPKHLRTIIIGGEAVSLERVKGWFNRHGTRVRLINSYGPTETTVVATALELTPEHCNYERLPIGRPLANTRAYILDQFQQEVPIGVKGELYLGGLSVANGYLHNEDLTRQRFLADDRDGGSFGKRSNARMYKTGDIVSWRGDGLIEFYGRSDHQLKIRGFRVELGEIEDAIRAHPFVRECAVVCHRLDDVDQRIIAYMVVDGPDIVNTVTMRQFLTSRLPEHMLPHQVVSLEQLPLTVSGKVDRNALRNLDVQDVAIADSFVEPVTEMQRSIAKIMADILQLQRVGLRDDFFAVGGNSLLALRLVSQIRRTFKLELPMVELFKGPTVLALSNYLSSNASTSSVDGVDEQVLSLASYQSTTSNSHSAESLEPNLVVLRECLSGEPIFCVHGLGGHVVNFIPLARELALDRPVVGIQGTGIDGSQRPHESIPEMAAEYVRQILHRQPSGAYQLIGWSMGGLIAMEIARLLQSQNRIVRPVIMLDSHLSLRDPSLEQVTEESVLRQIAPRLGLAMAELRKLPIEEQWEKVLVASQEILGANEADRGVEEIRRLAAMCKSHLIAISRYQQRPLDIELYMLQASKPWRLVDPRWKSLCSKFHHKTVQGSHYSMLAKPEVNGLAKAILEIVQAEKTSDGRHE